MSKEKIAIFGATGAVGRELLALLAARQIPKEFCIAFSRTKEELPYGKDIIATTPLEDFEKKDYALAFFSLDAPLAPIFIPKILEKKSKIVDLSSANRRNAPLVVPEINAHLLENSPNLIASPNCVATLIALALFPIEKRWGIKRALATTFQAVSGAGRLAMEALEKETKSYLDKTFTGPTFFKETAAFNLFLHESAEGEEEKIRSETRLLLNNPTLAIWATSVRVPVLRAHSISLNCALEKSFDLEEVEAVLQKAPGLMHAACPTPALAAHKEPIFWGNLRRDPTQENGLDLFISGDQILKGSALNALQIGELLCPSLFQSAKPLPTLS